MKPGDTASALALACDGGKRVRGVLLEKRGNLLLLDMPHGAWCLARGARVVELAAAPASNTTKNRRQAR